jgi:hypothetical protein
MEMLLVIFYAEELKRTVLALIRATDEVNADTCKGNAPPQRVPRGTAKAVDRALNALIADRAITAAQKAEIVELIDYRNVIAHQMHTLFADVSPERIVREVVAYNSGRLKPYSYNAVRRLQQFRRLLNELYRTHHYVSTLNYNALLFRSAEKTFLAQIKRLNRRISRLTQIRRGQIKIMNVELALKETEFAGEWHPQSRFSRHESGQLTKQGVEICYRLFDLGKSTMAVAHLTGLSLRAARKRRQMWTTLGAADRGR